MRGEGAAALAGLAGIAITQPVLDLLGRNPEFFVAGSYRPAQVVAFAVIVAPVPAAIAVMTVAIARRISRRAGEVAQAEFVVLFAFLFGLVVGRSLGIHALVPALAVAGAVAVGTVMAERRSPAAQGFLSYLAAGNVAFLLLFLFASPTAELVSRGGVSLDGHVTVPDLQGPVVVVVLDEFPLTTILRADGTINADRYPRLAELAADSTWLCPPDQCQRPAASSLTTALSDATVAYGHRVLPDALGARLTPIDASWGNFASGGARARVRADAREADQA